MTKQIFVQEYTRADGTKVRSHYRNIEETANMLSQGNSQGALDLINQTLSTIPEEKNALAELFSEGDLTPDEKTTLMEQLQYLQSFQNEAGRYQSLASNNLDTTSAADRIKEMFGNIKNKINEDKEFLAGYITNSNENSKETLWEKVQSPIYEDVSRIFLPSTSETVRNSTRDLEAVKSNSDVKIINKPSEIKNIEVEQALNNYGVPKDARGLIYNSNTKISEKISNSPELDKLVRDNIYEIKNKKCKFLDIDFETTNYINPEYINKSDIKKTIDSIDNHMSFQHAKLINPTIDKEGNFHSFLIDYSDYTLRKNGDIADIPNNWGYQKQQRKELENLF